MGQGFHASGALGVCAAGHGMPNGTEKETQKSEGGERSLGNVVYRREERNGMDGPEHEWYEMRMNVDYKCRM